MKDMEITKIRKRDGRIVNFDIKKIENAIAKAFSVTKELENHSSSNKNHDKYTIEYLAKQVYSSLTLSDVDIPGVEDIQNVVEAVLMKYNFVETAKEYIIYRNDRNRVRDMNSSLMDKYKEITYSAAIDSDIKRENANINADTAMGMMLKYGSEGSKAFYQMYMLKPKIAKAHAEGDIHIHDMDFATTGTTTCTQIDLISLFRDGFSTGHGVLREPNSIASYAALACIAIQSNQNDQHGGQSIVNFDRAMAEGVRKTYKKCYVNNMAKIFDVLSQTIDPNKDVAYSKIGAVPIDIIDTISTPYRNIRKSNIEEMLNIIYKDSGLYPRLGDADGYYEEEKAYLTRELQLGDEEADGIQNLARVYATEETDKSTYQAMESLIHNLNTMNSRAGAQTPFSSLNYGTDTSEEGQMVIKNILLCTERGLGNGETPIFPIQIFRVKDGINLNPGEPNYHLFKLACEVSAKRLFPNFSFIDAPFNLQYYKPDHPETEIAYMGCVNRDEVVTYKYNNILYVESIGRMWDRLVHDFEAKRQIEDESPESYEHLYINLENVQIYDSGANGFVNTPRIIRNVSYNRDWVRVKFKDGRSIKCTSDHPFPVEGRGRIQAKDLQTGDRIKAINNQYTEDTYTDMTEELAWALGIMCCKLEYDKKLTLRFFDMTKADTSDIMYRLRIAIRKYYGCLFTMSEYENLVSIHMTHTKELVNEFIEQFGDITNNKKHIPNWVFRSPENIRAAFFKGMRDAGDNITNKELILQEAALAKSLGFGTRIREYIAALNTVYVLDITDEKPEYCYVDSVENIIILSDYSYDVTTESDHFDVSGIWSHNCRTRVIGNVYDPTREICDGRGNLSFTTINLPRLGIKANGDIHTFYKLLNEKIDLVVEQLLDRFEIQCHKKVYNFPFLMGEGVWIDSKNLNWDDEIGEVLKHGTLSIGFIGLAETLVALTGKHHGESEKSQKLGLEIIGYMRQRMDEESEKRKLNFSLLATPAEGLSGRFIKIDKELYGEIPGVTDREYYTNSFHIPVYYPIRAFEKIKLEAPYHALTNAGHITYIELDGDPSNNLEAFERIVRYMKECGIGYGSINHAVDRDPVCGYTGIIEDVCPRCGRHEGEGVPLDKLKKLGLYKNINADTVGYHGDNNEESDRIPNSVQ